MAIQPNSRMRLLQGVPLDSTYTNTLYFANQQDQTNHFLTHYPYAKEFYAQSYQRVKSGVCRLQIKADDIYPYNYMMFQNTSYGSKWFYAFINRVEYINDAQSNIYYEIDVMQTWFFEHILRPSYVERETSATDNIGDNIVSEPVDLGDIKCRRIYDTGLFDSYAVVVCKSETTVSP